jgi:predicted ferric reductase
MQQTTHAAGGNRRGLRGLSGAALLALYLVIALGVLLFLLVQPFLHAVPRLSPDPMRAALIAGFGLHHTLAVGSHSADRLLAAFWIALSGLAILTLLFVYIVKSLMQLRRPYRVVANRQVADRIWELVINPERDAPIDFLAGQFAWLDGPHGHLVVPVPRPERWPGRLQLLYGNRLGAQILYREELESMAAEILDACLDPLERERWTYFVCGPPPMMNSVERSLLSFGVPGRQIIAERFKYD